MSFFFGAKSQEKDKSDFDMKKWKLNCTCENQFLG